MEESGEGRASGKKDVLEYIKIFTGKARAIQPPPMPAHTLFLNKKKKSPLEARVIYMPNRPGNPAGLLGLAMNRNRGIVSRPLAG